MKKLNLFVLPFAALSFAFLVGCSDDGSSAPAPQQKPQSTSMSIDTEDGAFSYEESSGDGSTSVNIDTDDNDKK